MMGFLYTYLDITTYTSSQSTLRTAHPTNYPLLGLGMSSLAESLDVLGMRCSLGADFCARDCRESWREVFLVRRVWDW